MCALELDLSGSNVAKIDVVEPSKISYSSGGNQDLME